MLAAQSVEVDERQLRKHDLHNREGACKDEPRKNGNLTAKTLRRMVKAVYCGKGEVS